MEARAALVVCFVWALGCSGTAASPHRDAGSPDGGHASDAKADARVDARRDAWVDAARDAARDTRADAARDARADGKTDAADASACGIDGAVLTVSVVSGAHLTESAPSVDVTATVPPGCWSSVQVQVTASSDCTGTPPTGQNWPTNCDPFDRLAQVTLAGPDTTPMFVLDAVTSFGGSATWTQDVTDYVSLLTGTHAYHLEIDTYNDAKGLVCGTAASHDATVSIVLTPGTPPHDVVLAIPLLRSDIVGGGDGGTPALSTQFTAPAGANQARFDYFTSGHGANGPLEECDEFCWKQNNVSLDGTNLYATAPMSNCSDNCTHVPISGSVSCGGSTYNYVCQQNPCSCPPSSTATRSNWCPSQIILPIAVPFPGGTSSGQHNAGVGIVNADGTWSIGLSAVFYR